MIREWTEQNFEFVGYVTGFEPPDLGERDKLRGELGYGDSDRVCIVTVGGSGVGADLLRRVIAAYPEAKERVPSLRMIVVAGPRIEPASLPSFPGLEVVPYVHNLYRHLAACDLAVVQGGLSTAMELTAQKRPFLYFPLRHHFEQSFHVRHRLDRYGAGRRMDFEDSPPDRIAAGIAEESIASSRTATSRPMAPERGSPDRGTALTEQGAGAMWRSRRGGRPSDRLQPNTCRPRWHAQHDNWRPPAGPCRVMRAPHARRVTVRPGRAE